MRPQLIEDGESFKGNIPSRVSVVVLASPNEVETGSVLVVLYEAGETHWGFKVS